MKYLTVLAMALALLVSTDVSRPRILGAAHAAFYVSDLAKARTFYTDFLGFAEAPFALKKSDGAERIIFIKINDTQYIELFAEPTRGEGQLNHIAIQTDDTDRMRDYLAARGVAVPSTVGRGQTGNKNFTVKDPDGHTVEIVQYLPDSKTSREAGRSMPATRIANRLMHMGFLVGKLDASQGFYSGVLGFREFWRGQPPGSATLSWVNMRMPDGEDYVEFMLYDTLPAPADRGTKNHISLEVQDAQRAVDELQRRAARGLYAREIVLRIGVNRRRQVNLFDPDGTRVELMESRTVDEQAAATPVTRPRR